MGNDHSSHKSHHNNTNNNTNNRNESENDRTKREERARTYESKVQKLKPKSAEEIRDAHWKAYAQIGNEKDKEKNNQTNDMLPPRRGSASVSASASSTTTTLASVTPSMKSLTPPVRYGNKLSSSQTLPDSTSMTSSAPSSPIPSLVDGRSAHLASLENKVRRTKTANQRSNTSQWEAYRAADETIKAKEINQDSPSPNLIFTSSDSSSSMFATPEFRHPSDTTSSPILETLKTQDEDLYQQALSLLTSVAQMPKPTVSLLSRICSNALRANEVDGQKFRKVKLNSDKVRQNIVEVKDALEVLYFAGFTESVEWNDTTQQQEKFLYFDPLDSELSRCQAVVESLERFM
jgi:hypothetical protein